MMRGNWGFPGGGESFGHHMGGVGIAGMILMVILWIAVIAAIVIGIRALVVYSRRDRTAATASAVAPAGSYGVAAGPAPVASVAPSLLAIVEERYARGEIDREVFLQQKKDLGLTAPEAAPAAGPAPETPAPQATN